MKTPSEIQEINRQIMAGTYVHVEDEQEPEVIEEKPKRGRPQKTKPEDAALQMGDSDE